MIHLVMTEHSFTFRLPNGCTSDSRCHVRVLYLISACIAVLEIAGLVYVDHLNHAITEIEDELQDHNITFLTDTNVYCANGTLEYIAALDPTFNYFVAICPQNRSLSFCQTIDNVRVCPPDHDLHFSFADFQFLLTSIKHCLRTCFANVASSNMFWIGPADKRFRFLVINPRTLDAESLRLSQHYLLLSGHITQLSKLPIDH